MPPELIPDDSDYASEEDSDFAPDAAPTNDVSESEDDESADEELKAKQPASKRKRADEEAEDAGIENSGDEAIIEKGLKKRRKKGKKGDEEEGGEGGLVKTRSMRAAEKIENKKTISVDASQATIDVDAVWADMISGKPSKSAAASIAPTEPTTTQSPQSPSTERKNPESSQDKGKDRSPSTFEEGPDAMIMIKRTYTFAGKVHTEQKLVPRSSAEAKLFLSTQSTDQNSKPAEDDNSPFTNAPKRRLKLARRSIFEPITEGLLKRTDLHFGLKAATGEGILRKEDGGKKLNTVEKSAMDWAGFVDKEGIADELDKAGKSKGAYKARQEFLARVESKKIEDERRARGLPV